MIFRRVRFTHQNSLICDKPRLFQNSHVVRGVRPTRMNWRTLQMILPGFLCVSVASHDCIPPLWLILFRVVTK
jgi:hypothetical protein